MLEAMVREFVPWPLGDLYALGLHKLATLRIRPGAFADDYEAALARLGVARPRSAVEALPRITAVVSGLPRSGFMQRPPALPAALLALQNDGAAELAGDDFDGAYTRTGMDWQPSSGSLLAIEQGKVRVKLYGAGRSQMSVRLKHGWPMLTYRIKFD